MVCIFFFLLLLLLISVCALFIVISWRLITLQYCSGFCHALTWISHGFTCAPHPEPPSRLPLPCFASSLYTLSVGLFSLFQLESTVGLLHPGAGNGICCVLISIFRNILWFNSQPPRGHLASERCLFGNVCLWLFSFFSRRCLFLLLFSR